MAASREIVVTFGQGLQVNAQVGDHSIHTDQPVANGGTDSAPSPYDLFLASIASCAGFYVLRFCQSRGLPIDGIRIVQRVHNDPEAKVLSRVDLTIETPPDFPAKYGDAIVRVVEGCSVKRAIRALPDITCAWNGVGDKGFACSAA